MLFNTIVFALFFPLVFLAYWLFLNKNIRLQNLFIVVVSYLFYGWWDWRFLFLILFISFNTYICGILIDKYLQKSKLDLSSNNIMVGKYILIFNVILNLLILCAFKYFNFFSENLITILRFFGFNPDWITLQILLPIGISFYTFQALSYIIDVYHNKISPTKDIVSYFAFVSFFPQLVAGPIERSTSLLPQFYNKRIFDYYKTVNATRQILWGLFKKIVVADNCATVANTIFSNYSEANGSTLFIGALMFTFQIYGDFSGYSDIAIGVARLLGFDLVKNFNYPYFSTNLIEFWRRWHISLNTWFRDYIYIPLGGSKSTKWISIRNTIIIFLLSGLWHGANWTFIFWSIYHALLFVPIILFGKHRKHTNNIAKQNILAGLIVIMQMLITFLLVVFGWIIFRSETILDAFYYIIGIFNTSIISKPIINDPLNFVFGTFGISVMLLFEWKYRFKAFGLDLSNTKLNRFVRICIYLFLAITIIYYGGKVQTFIYFQF